MSMLSNQRYFPIFDAQGRLTREFVIVSNADPKVSATVVSGNERVVRPRLDDAKFFFEEDLKRPMEEFVQRLGIVTLQEKLGTTLQKVGRMERLAKAVAQAACEDEQGVSNAVRAAHLAKADLVSQGRRRVHEPAGRHGRLLRRGRRRARRRVRRHPRALPPALCRRRAAQRHLRQVRRHRRQARHRLRHLCHRRAAHRQLRPLRRPPRSHRHHRHAARRTLGPPEGPHCPGPLLLRRAGAGV